MPGMTEAEWLTSDDPLAMIEFLRDGPAWADAVPGANNRWQLETVSTGLDRKFRLFACAACRRIWERIPTPVNRVAVVAVEEWLEFRRTGDELVAALRASSAVEYDDEGKRRGEPGYWAVKYLGRGFYKMTAAASALVVAVKVLSLADDAYGAALDFELALSFYVHAGVFIRPFRWPEPVPAGVRFQRAALASLLRDVFGNPFRPPPEFPAPLRTPEIVALARSIYDDGAFDRLPELADALEAAGCADAALLAHLRGEGSHVRGCWAVDVILEKT